jgi:hypothetical protein
MPHRSDSSLPRHRNSDYYDDYCSRPHSRQSGHRHHHHHRSHSGSYDDLDAHSGHGSKHHHSSRSQTPVHPSQMYAPPKLTQPQVPYDDRRRNSSFVVVARQPEYDSDADFGDEPPRHAHLLRSNRHSTFPPSAYYPPPKQRQMQPYQQPYVHPALPPQSPRLESTPTGPLARQYTPRPGLAYEPPSHTYQPPTVDPPRPRQPVRADSWAHSASSESGSDRSHLSRTSSKSQPPHSRSLHDEAREKTKDTPHGPWEKAKKAYNSKTANNTAELALFGLLAVAKAL